MKINIVLSVLITFTISPMAKAVNPAPDGGYPGGNTAEGTAALFSLTSGIANTAVGLSALHDNTTGGSNVAIGSSALAKNTTCSFNMAVGNTCYIANIYDTVQPVMGTDPDYVTIASNGKIGHSNFNGSSRRFKHDIQPMDKASEVIFALKPVSFRYNKEYDSAERPSFGLIAEEVAQVGPDLVGRNKKSEPESVRYEQINAMLLNEFLKEHKKVDQLEAASAQQRNDFEATIAELRKEIAGVVARSRDQDDKIQKVSAQVELNKPGAQTVLNGSVKK